MYKEETQKREGIGDAAYSLSRSLPFLWKLLELRLRKCRSKPQTALYQLPMCTCHVLCAKQDMHGLGLLARIRTSKHADSGES
jgi:hypothetical protein